MTQQKIIFILLPDDDLNSSDKLTSNFTSQFVVHPMAADDFFHRFLGAHFDPCAKDRWSLHAIPILHRSEIGGVSDRSGGFKKVSVPHVPESR